MFSKTVNDPVGSDRHHRSKEHSLESTNGHEMMSSVHLEANLNPGSSGIFGAGATNLNGVLVGDPNLILNNNVTTF